MSVYVNPVTHRNAARTSEYSCRWVPAETSKCRRIAECNSADTEDMRMVETVMQVDVDCVGIWSLVM